MKRSAIYEISYFVDSRYVAGFHLLKSDFATTFLEVKGDCVLLYILNSGGYQPRFHDCDS